MASPIGVAIIGGGLFVKAQHLPAVLECDLLSLKAIYSRSLRSAQETAGLITGRPDARPDLYSDDSGAGKSYRDLLQRDDVSAVIIALPILAQPQFVEAALAAGKHVLAEKPIAKDVAAARELIDAYHRCRRVSDSSSNGGGGGVTLAVAENVRFYPSFAHAAREAAKLGRVQHFSVRVMWRVDAESNKWYKTEWRQRPAYQGGFLLDGGVHWAAATRMMLLPSIIGSGGGGGGGEESNDDNDNSPETVRAFTHQVNEHLPPIDTVAAIIKTRSGATGVFQSSAGALVSAFEWDFGYEKGTVRVVGETVTVRPVGGQETITEFPRTSGVGEEVAAWARALVEGRPNPLQTPEQALADLEFMEKMFRSGDENGSTQRYEFM